MKNFGEFVNPTIIEKENKANKEHNSKLNKKVYSNYTDLMQTAKKD